MSERRYPLVVFDWDGTLADSTAVIRRALQRAAGDLAIRCLPTSRPRSSSAWGLRLRLSTRCRRCGKKICRH